jgi:hypothetical protein
MSRLLKILERMLIRLLRCTGIKSLENLEEKDKRVFAVVDRWHTHTGLQEVRSDRNCFDTFEDFLSWVKQHGGTEEEIYEVKPTKSALE